MATVTHSAFVPPEQFAVEAEPALRGVFRTLEFTGTEVPTDLLLASVPDRLILDTGDSFMIDAYQYYAIREAAAAVGDSYMLYTLLTAFNGQLPTWRLPLRGYEEYYRAEDQLPSEIKGIALTRVLYSPTAKWAVLCPEYFAVVAGSPEFIAKLKTELPHWESDLYEFLKACREAYRDRGIDIGWIQPLLNHVYGVNAPTFLEAEA